MAMKSPETFVQEYNGKAIDDDGAYGVQCVDGFRIGCRYVGIPVMPTPNNWADGYWTCQNADGSLNKEVEAWQTRYFDKVPVDQLTDGCWVIWPQGSRSHPSSHIAMYYHGQEFGERQYEGNRSFCLKSTDFSDAYGGLMPKTWSGIEDYESDITIGGRTYHMYGQSSRLRTVVYSPGLNSTARIEEMDLPFDVYAKITGVNFFQNDPENPAGQPYGMTFGDISDPINGVYQSLPNQDSTLYLDIDTGEWGDCTGVDIDPTHNVFSPALIYPRGKNVQYARMVGIGHKNIVSSYTFYVRFENGSCAFGKTAQDTTSDQIAADFMTIPGVALVAFLDGGGSAQMMRYLTKEKKVEYIKTGRKTSGCLMMIGAPIPQNDEDPEPVPVTSDPVDQDAPDASANGHPAEETEKDEEESMENENKPEQTGYEAVPDWKDPDAGKTTIMDRIVALLAIKSIITVACLYMFGTLVLKGSISPDQFMTVFSVVIAFYFGTTFQKGGR